jgi:hypothetical protein
MQEEPMRHVAKTQPLCEKEHNNIVSQFSGICEVLRLHNCLHTLYLVQIFSDQKEIVKCGIRNPASYPKSAG